MTFKKSLKILNIQDYEQRIFNSNSHGELLHIPQYIFLAENIGKEKWFRGWFEAIVKEAEKSWDRPESVFQHTVKILQDQIKGTH